MFESRLRIVFALGMVYFLVLVARLFTMQVLDADEWREESARLSRSRVRLAARRGAILDRNGDVLATDRHEWDLVIRLDHFDGSSWCCGNCGRPTVSTSPRPPVRCRDCRGREFRPGESVDLRERSALPGIDRSEFVRELARVRADWRRHVDREKRRLRALKARVRDSRIEAQYRGWQWILFRNVSLEVVREVALNPDRYRGLSLRSTFRRVRTAGKDSSGIVGAVSGVYRDEKDAYLDKGLTLTEIFRLRIGRSGLENILEERLASREGYRIVDRDARGRVREILEEVPSHDGETVRISLDLDLQRFVREELARAGAQHRAIGVFFSALDPATGEVIAHTGWQPERGGVNLAHTPVVPGSVYKVVTAIAGIESGELDPGVRFDCTGKWHGIGCHGNTHGPVDVRDALAVSCNGYFAHAAGEMGIDVLSWWARRLGFGENTGLEVTGESPGLVPDPAWKVARFARDENFRRIVETDTWHRGETWQVGFGQGALLVTPLQVARLMAIVANGGHAVRPTLVLGEGRIGERIVSPAAIALVQEGLSRAVVRGTAARTNLALYRAAGKTGTGDLPGGMKNVAWFAGYAPADDPKVAFACCFVDVEGFGGGIAGPVCAEFLKEFERP